MYIFIEYLVSERVYRKCYPDSRTPSSFPSQTQKLTPSPGLVVSQGVWWGRTTRWGCSASHNSKLQLPVPWGLGFLQFP